MNSTTNEAPFGAQPEIKVNNQALVQELGAEAVAASVDKTVVPIQGESIAETIEVRTA